MRNKAVNTDGIYHAFATSDVFTGEAQIQITADCINFNSGEYILDFADLCDYRLIDYVVYLKTSFGEIALSKLGGETENFFEKLWEAFDAKSLKALFSEDDAEAVMSAEGEYAYTECDKSAKGKAKLCLYSNNVSILPHDEGARKVILCFVTDISRKEYTLELATDTKERYTLAKMGAATDKFHEMLVLHSQKSAQIWQEKYDELKAGLEKNSSAGNEKYLALRSVFGSDEINLGLFTPGSSSCWLSVIKGKKALVEIISEEATATYLYSFDIEGEAFLKKLRHAMADVGIHRELIYLENDRFEKNSLYRMAEKRSSYVRFLRECCCGRVIHNEAWERNLTAFFAPEN